MIWQMPFFSSHLLALRFDRTRPRRHRARASSMPSMKSRFAAAAAARVLSDKGKLAAKIISIGYRGMEKDD